MARVEKSIRGQTCAVSVTDRRPPTSRLILPTCSVEMDPGPGVIPPLQFLPAEGAGGAPRAHVSRGTSGPSHPRSCPAAPHVPAPAVSSQLCAEFWHRAPRLRPLPVRLSDSQRADFHQVLEGRFPTSPAGMAPGWHPGAGQQVGPQPRWGGCFSKVAVLASLPTLSSQHLMTQSPVTVTHSSLNAPRSNYRALLSPGRTLTDTTDFTLVSRGLVVHSNLAGTAPPVQF